jgi:hypothetical protein
MRGVIPPLPNTPSWRGAQLKIKDRDTYEQKMAFLLDEIEQEIVWKY